MKIEDLFFNTPTRLSALRSPSEEYARILDVVTKYAIHNSTVSFQCKKVGLVWQARLSNIHLNILDRLGRPRQK